DIINACPSKEPQQQSAGPHVRSWPSAPSGSSRIISEYLAANGLALEKLLPEFGWKYVGSDQKQNLWQRPNAPAGATRFSARQGTGQNGSPGIWNFSGNADIEVDAWHGAESLFVHYRFAGDW